MRLNPILREWLEIWGDWKQSRVPGLDYPSQTCEALAMEMHLHQSKGNESAMQSKERRGKAMPRDPGYNPHPRTQRIGRKVDIAISQIEQERQLALYCKFVAGMMQTRAAEVCGCQNGDGYKLLWEKSAREVARLLNIRACY